MGDFNKYVLLVMTSLSIGVMSAASYLESGDDPKLFCYYSSFAQNRRGLGKFQPNDIDPDLCTHVIFAFADLVKGSFLKPSSWNDIPNGKDKGLYARTQELKKKNPKLKILLALGGWKIGSEPFIPMINDMRKRRLFVRNVVRYLRKYGFDGLDMDWEFPGTRGSAADDKFKFTSLMKELRTAFERESRQTGRDRLLLTMAAAGGSYFIGLAYEPEKIVQFVDYILLMTYNYHGSWNDFTGHHSGLFPRADESGGEREWNQAWTIDYWLNKAGASKDKIVVGIATYGMTFTLADPKDHGLKAAAVGGGNPGPYTGESGILAYYEICQKLGSGWNSVWIDEQKVPYAYSGSQWVGYDNIDSISYKANYIRQKKLAGAFIWSVETDDFSGTCGDGKYPLLNTIATILRQPATEALPSNNYGTDYSSIRDVDDHGVYPSGLAVSRHGLLKQGDEYDYNYMDMADYGGAPDTSVSDTVGQYESNFIGYDDSTGDGSTPSKRKGSQSYTYEGGYGTDFEDEGYLNNQNPSDLYDNTIQSNNAIKIKEPVSQEYRPQRRKPTEAGRDTIIETGHSLIAGQVSGPSHNSYPERRSRKPQRTNRYKQGTDNIDTRGDAGDRLYRSDSSYQSPAYTARETRRENRGTSPGQSTALARRPLSRSRPQSRQVATNAISRPPDRTREVSSYRSETRTPKDDAPQQYQRPTVNRAPHASNTPQHNPKYSSRQRHAAPDNSMDVVYGQSLLPRDKERLRSFLRNADDSYLTRLLSGPLQDNIVGLESQGTDQYPDDDYSSDKYPDVNHSQRQPETYQNTEPERSRRRQYFKEGSTGHADQALEPTLSSDVEYQRSKAASDKYSYQSNAQSGDPPRTKVVQSWQYYTPGITCTSPGLYAHPSSCKQYYICVRHSNRWYKFHLTCPKGLGFKPSRAVCDRVPSCQDN